MYEFIAASLVELDQGAVSSNFHLSFLVKLSKFLGFGPQNTMEILGGRMLEPHEDAALEAIIESDYRDEVKMSTEQRRNLLDAILQFYAAHVDSFGEIKSVNVLRTILS